MSKDETAILIDTLETLSLFTETLENQVNDRLCRPKDDNDDEIMKLYNRALHAVFEARAALYELRIYQSKY